MEAEIQIYINSKGKYKFTVIPHQIQLLVVHVQTNTCSLITRITTFQQFFQGISVASW